MADTWVTDITHFLDEKGGIPEDLSGPARSLANHVGAVITAATAPGGFSDPEIEVKCRCRPNRGPCPGVINHIIEPGGEERIFWRCTVCGDNGEISNWKGSIWDCRQMGVLS